MILEITDKTIERAVGVLMLIAEDYSGLVWDAIEDYGEYDEDDMIATVWGRAVDNERIDSEYFYDMKCDEDQFEHCLVLLRELNLVTNNQFVKIHELFNEFMAYRANWDNVDKWREKLKSTITDCIKNKE